VCVPFEVAFWVWSLLSLASGLTAMALLEKETRGHVSAEKRRLLFAIVLLAYFPTWANFQFGQLALFLLLILTAAWLLARRQRDGWAGVLLGIALSVKVFAALFGLFLLIRRRWRMLFSMGITFTLCTLIGIGLIGWESSLEYRRVVGQITWSGTSWNPSFLGFSTRLFGGGENVPFFYLPWMTRILASLFSVTAALAYIWVLWPCDGEESDLRFDSGFMLTLPLILLISPLGWMYYFPILLLTFVTLWHWIPQYGFPRRWRTLLIVSFGLSTVPALHILPVTTIDRLIYSEVFFLSLLLLAYLSWRVTFELGVPKPREDPFDPRR
jgi:hypothetical protein